jgi:hypothetical protein
MTDFHPIAIGEIYPNYKALCKQLNEPIKTGGAKTNQLIHWQTCFLWEKKVRAFKITKIIKPLDQRPHKQRECSKWYKSITIIILNKIAETLPRGSHSDGYNELVLTSTEAYMVLGLCNGNFKNVKSKKFYYISINHRKKFQSVVTNNFYYIFNNVLKSLKNQSIINYKKTYRFSNKAGATGTRLANTDELSIILAIVKKHLDLYNLKSEFEVMFYHKGDKFYEELKPLFESEGFYNCFKVYRIYFTESSLFRFNQYLDSVETQTTAIIDINGKSYTHLIGMVETINSGADNLEDDMNFKINFEKLINLTIPSLN